MTPDEELESRANADSYIDITDDLPCAECGHPYSEHNMGLDSCSHEESAFEECWCRGFRLPTAEESNHEL
jgi:hypothetical protein